MRKTIINYLEYSIGALFIGALSFFAHFFDHYLKLPHIISFFFEITFLFGMIFVFKKLKRRPLISFNFDKKQLLWLILPFACGLILFIGPLNQMRSARTILFTLLDIIALCMLETAYFRMFGFELFKEKIYYWPNIIFTSLIYSLTYLSLLFDHSLGETFLFILIFFGIGIFSMALYLKTKNIIIAFSSEFAFYLIYDIFALFARSTLIENELFVVIISILIAISFVCAGCFMASFPSEYKQKSIQVNMLIK
ncbi:MAG: hypothetical protein HUJ61_01955 [Bacilli bacterium]|nr:hypothetical protein [Bacilli bacterium]